MRAHKRVGRKVRAIGTSKSVRKTTALVAAGTIIAALAAVGAGPVQADSKDLLDGLVPSPTGPSVNPSYLPNLVNQDPKSTHSQNLNVIVGKSMLIATSPGGTPKNSVLLANTQVSGDGSTTVQVPMGGTSVRSGDGFASPNMQGDNVVYDVSNGSNQIQTLAANNASYGGKLPLSVKVAATVDGKNVDPEDFVNVSGHVKISYTFTNQTSEPTQITYNTPNGQTVTETVSLPVPFGGAFSTTLPSTFADVNAPWAEGGVGPTGTVLAGTLFMFPPLGKDTQTLTLEARAENASLPAATLNALPLTLSDNSIGRLAFKYSPVASNALDQLYQGGVTGQSMLLKYQLMLLKYSALAAGINEKYVSPILKKIEEGGPAFNDAVNQVQELADGAAGLAVLLPQATNVIDILATTTDTANARYQEAISSPTSTLNKIIDQLSVASNNVGRVANALNSDLGDEIIAAGLAGAQNLAKTAVNMCPQLNTYFTQYTTTYQAEIDQAAGLLIAAGEPASANQLTALNRFLASFIASNQGYVDDCMELAPTVYEWTKQAAKDTSALQKMIDKLIADVKAASKKLDQGVTGAQLFQELEPVIGNALDHNCNYNKATGAGIQQCGLVQQVDFLDTKMKYATDQVVNVMAPGTAKAAALIPFIEKYFALAQKYAPVAQNAIDALPAELKLYADKLGIYAGIAGTAVNGIENAGDVLAKTTAELEAMDKKAAAGEGIAGGPATGANTNLAAYMYAIPATSDSERQNAIQVGLAVLLFVVGAGVAAAIAARRN
ncbi:MAG: hypothetical protein V9E85_00775 [Candidatus Nanopelagicales bacterium]|jgi:hypothetical protein